ncbi:MAG: hypothetical protein GX053_00675 [Tissierella sp.]|nr:hypothetical protein [Tissierella sp.]
MIKKVSKKNRIGPYLFQFWSLIVFIIIWEYYKLNIQVFDFSNLLIYRNILLILVAVVPTSIIAYHGSKIKPTYQFGLKNFLDGASMEIPMRLLTQNLFAIFGINMIIYKSISLDILMNAIIFIQFIIVQEVIQGRKISSDILPEIIASFWFSISAGILYKDTGNIIMPMLAHGLQRMVTYNIRKVFVK